MAPEEKACSPPDYVREPFKKSTFTMYGSPRKHSGSARHEGSRGPSSAERGVQQAGPGDGTATRVRAGGVTGPRRRGCAAPGYLREAPAAAAGLKRAREGLFHASLRAGSVQTHGAFAVFGQLVGLRGSQTGLTKQNDGAREGERMRERMSGAERGLQAA